MKCKVFKVSGKVQGVFFRATAKEQAELLGIRGIVRNERDGSVYIEAEGEEDALHHFMQWCKVGPSRAIVTEVKASEVELRHFSSFEVTR